MSGHIAQLHENVQFKSQMAHMQTTIDDLKKTKCRILQQLKDTGEKLFTLAFQTTISGIQVVEADITVATDLDNSLTAAVVDFLKLRSLACFVLLPRAECLWLLSGFRFLLILPLNALLKAFDLPDHSLVSDGSPGRGNSRRVTLQPKVVSTSIARSIPGSAKCLAAFELF
ncbi:hypothetical protein C3L33_08847, partial [Rhododendron williamsianum]